MKDQNLSILSCHFLVILFYRQREYKTLGNHQQRQERMILYRTTVFCELFLHFCIYYAGTEESYISPKEKILTR